ncbi:OmpH family outer membrane protein [Candidatus Omnitrophota bacterium]
MRRKITVAAVMALAAGFLFFARPASSAEEANKMGFVDLARVFDQYSKTVEFDKSLEEKGRSKEDERKGMVEEIRKLQDEAALLSDEARAQKQPQIDEKIKTLRDFNRDTQGALVKERNDRITEILADIQGVVETYAKENDYDVVLNSRMLLFGDQQHDITEEILSKLNK